MAKFSLYGFCLRKVLLLLRNQIWKPGRENPFCFLPQKVVQDLLSAYLRVRHSKGFRAADLEPLLSSGNVREFTLFDIKVDRELRPALKSLASGSQNLEAITLIRINAIYENTPDETEALQELLKKSPNLKVVHCEVEFDLKALRNCKKLQKIMLHFVPEQPLYDFLERKFGFLQSLDSLEVFKFCNYSIFDPDSYLTLADHFATIFRHCPAITSFGYLDSSGVLAKLYPDHISLREKFFLFWRNLGFSDNLAPRDVSSRNSRTDVTSVPFLKEVYFLVQSISSISLLSRLGNLEFLDIRAATRKDFGAPFCDVLKDIGLTLKYLRFHLLYPIDMSVFLQNCPNLVALSIRCPKLPKFAQPAVSLPNLESLLLFSQGDTDEKQILPLFSDCNNLRELYVVHSHALDDRTLETFVSRNSLSNLKIAFFNVNSLELTEHGLRKFLMSAPNLEKIEIVPVLSDSEYKLETMCLSLVEKAVLETNHKASFNENPYRFYDEFFSRIKGCDLV